MSNPLTAVRRAANRRQDADRDYRESIRAAREAGHTLEAIGQAAGITYQGVAYLLNPPERRKEQNDG